MCGQKSMTDVNYEGAVEAILFAMGDSVELKKIAAAVELPEDMARQVVYRLMEKYDLPESGVKIIELGDSFQMCTKPEYYEYLIRVAKQPKKQALTDVLLETLSIVAYKQPVTKIEIEKIRGVSCDHAVNKLIEFDLIEEKGRLDAPGRPILFGTTEEFLRCFGLQSLGELPAPEPGQAEEMKLEAEEEVREKEMLGKAEQEPEKDSGKSEEPAGRMS